MRVASFDVFDTTVTRACTLPEDVYPLVGQRLSSLGLADDPDSFAKLRSRAEHSAWTKVHFRGAITIDDIYAELSTITGWSSQDSQRALETEIQVELELAEAVGPIRRLIAERRARGDTVCFISDMHLSGEHITDILRARGLWQEGDLIFVSADHGASKFARGTLFRLVLRKAAILPWRMSHLGDHPRSDVWMARLNLIRGHHFPHARPTDRERRLANRLQQFGPNARRIAAVSKFTRLGLLTDDRKSAEPVVALVDAVAPLVVGFSLWLLREAQRRNIRKLFFLSRDMQVVHAIASRLASFIGSDVECHYLYASRASWQPAAFDADRDMFWLLDQLDEPTPERALGRLLPPAQIEEMRRDGLLGRANRAGTLKQSVEEILAQPACKARISRAVDLRRRLLLRYMAQSGFSPTADCALVDTGWRGSLQRALWRAYSTVGSAPMVQGFYLGLRHAGEWLPSCAGSAFLDDAVVNQLGYSIVALMEAFFSADHGSVQEFIETAEGEVRAKLGAPPQASLNWQMMEVRVACLHYLDELQRRIEPRELVSIEPQTLATPFLDLCRAPSHRDVRQLRRWRIDVGRDRPRLIRVATAPGVRDIVKLIVARLRGHAAADVYLSGPWVAGSLRLAPGLLHTMLQLMLPPVEPAGL